MRYVGEASLGRSIFTGDSDSVPHLAASRCPLCGDVRFPARTLCPNDLTECDPYALSGDGTIYETVELSLAPKGFEPPFWVGFVDLDGGARVFAQIAAPDDGQSEPRHGDRVQLQINVIQQGDNPLYGPGFWKV